MYLNDLLKQMNISRYRLAKLSGVPQTTVIDICSGRSRIERCSAETLYRIAKTLNVSMESLIEADMEDKHDHKRISFELFKSTTCHLVKAKGEARFVIDIITGNEIRKLYNRKWYPEAFYILGMIDLISNKLGVPLCENYNDLRSRKLDKLIYPASIVLLDTAFKTDRYKQESLKKAIPEFMRFNIVESEVCNVY